MIVYPGNIHKIGGAIQLVKGTPAAAPSNVFYTTGGTIAPTPEVVDLEETTESRLRSGAFIARSSAGGTPTAYARPSMLGLLLYGAMGAKSVTGAGPYVHVFTLAAIQPYLTLFRNLGGLVYERFVDCKVAELVLTSTEGAAMTVAANILGQSAQQETADPVATPTPETTHPFIHYDSAAALLVEGVNVSSISSITITINLGVAVQPGNTINGIAVSEGMQGITIVTDQLVSDRALWNRLHYGSASPAAHAPQATAPIELAGSPAGIDAMWTRGTNILRMAATRLMVKSIAGMEPNNANDPLRMQVTYGVYKPASGSGLTATLTNATTAYTGS